MKNMKKLFLVMPMLLTIMGLVACEKAVLDEQQKEMTPVEGNVIIRTSLYNIVPFETRSVQDVADFSNTLKFVFYQNDEKVKDVTQKKNEGSYGEIGVTLQPGTYQLLVLAHSSTSNPTVSGPSNIQFTNTTGYSDTFYYYGDLVVTSEQQTYDVQLQRATSMVRVTIQDAIPSEVKTIRLYYTGESGVFNAVTGMGGTTNSKQSITYNVEGMSAPLSLCAYTFLRNETGTLNMTITAYDKDNNVKAEKELKNIPMKNCMVTEYNGNLFSGEGGGSAGAHFNLTAETEWKVFQQLSF